MVNEDLFYELNITEDGYVIGRNNHDEADSVSIIGYTEESKHARLFVAAPKLLQLVIYTRDYMVKEGSFKPEVIEKLDTIIAKALGETK